MTQVFQMIVNNGSPHQASYTVAPVTLPPISGDLQPKTFAVLDVPFAESYIVSIDDVTVTVNAPNVSVTRLAGHNELLVTMLG